MPELPISDAFEWARYPWGQALRCRPLAEVAHHCFTTRQPVIPSGDGMKGDGWHSIAQGFGLPRPRLVRLAQVHGAGVITIRTTAETRETVGEWGAADAAVTDDATVALSVRTADCVPVLIGDRNTGAVAAVHAGWRGAASGVIAAAVRALASAFSANPADLVAAVGPSIGPCCYRVGPELRDQYLEGGHPTDLIECWFTRASPSIALLGVPGSDPVSPDGRAPLWLDMWRVVSDQLMRAGLTSEDVHVARLCTSCARDIFHSYRVDGPGAGRMAGVIRAGGEARSKK